jgi:hypothetical protein
VWRIDGKLPILHVRTTTPVQVSKIHTDFLCGILLNKVLIALTLLGESIKQFALKLALVFYSRDCFTALASLSLLKDGPTFRKTNSL